MTLPTVLASPVAVASMLFNFFWPSCIAGGILVPGPGIEPMPSAAKAWSPTHWTAREVPLFLNKFY